MVAVRTNEADRLLASPPAGIRLFLVYGSDPGAITERTRAVEKVALKRGGGDLVTRFGSDEVSADAGLIADEAYAASLFGGEPVIALRILDGRHNVMAALGNLIARPPEAGWVIVEAGDLSKTSPLRKAFEDSSHALAVATYPLEGTGLASFIRAAADEAGATIDLAAQELLAENLGGDRLASRGELDKLFLYVGDSRHVSAEDVAAIVGDTADASTDQAIDAALLGEHEALETALSRMRAEGSSPIGLATLALRHLITLQGLRAKMDSGMGAETAVRSALPPPAYRRRGALIQSALMRWHAEAIEDARRLIDRAIAFTRLQSSLEEAAISQALHEIALKARRLKRGS